MKRKFLAITAVVAATITLCVGCAGNDSAGGANSGTEQATKTQESSQTTDEINVKSEYKESKVEFPEGQPFCMGNDKSGKPILFMFDDKATTPESAAYKKYVFQDGKWAEADISKTNELLKKNKINMLYSLTETEGGKIFGIAKNENGMYLYDLTEKFKAYPDAFGKDEIKAFQVEDDKSVLVMSGDGSASLRNFDGKVINKFGEGNGIAQAVGDKVFAVDSTGSKITIYNMSNAEVEDEYKTQITQQGIAFVISGDDEIYAATENGIYLLENGEMKEVVPEKAMSTATINSSAWINALYVQGDEFWVSYVEEGNNSREFRMVSFKKE